jgi:hypothetical protein
MKNKLVIPDLAGDSQIWVAYVDLVLLGCEGQARIQPGQPVRLLAAVLSGAEENARIHHGLRANEPANAQSVRPGDCVGR